jgi:CheY-like chemotaxis protein
MIFVFILEDNEDRMKLFRRVLPADEFQITHAVSAEEAYSLLKTRESWDTILLDHDLGGLTYVSSNDRNTGYRVANWIRRNKIKYNQLVFHTQNPVGADNMSSALPDGIKIPFPELFEVLLRNLKK